MKKTFEIEFNDKLPVDELAVAQALGMKFMNNMFAVKELPKPDDASDLVIGDRS
jgi:hypothetical protein